MNDKSARRDPFSVAYLFSVGSTFLVLGLSFFVIGTDLKPFSFLIFVLIIAFSIGEIVKFAFSQEMNFLGIHVPYRPDRPLLRLNRFVFLVMDIGLAILLGLQICFSKLYGRFSSPFGGEVRGGIILLLLFGFLGAVFFGISLAVQKMKRIPRSDGGEV